MKGFTDFQLARILEDLTQAVTTPEHKDEGAIVTALKQITEGAIEVLENRKVVNELREYSKGCQSSCCIHIREVLKNTKSNIGQARRKD